MLPSSFRLPVPSYRSLFSDSTTFIHISSSIVVNRHLLSPVSCVPRLYSAVEASSPLLSISLLLLLVNTCFNLIGFGRRQRQRGPTSTVDIHDYHHRHPPPADASYPSAYLWAPQNIALSLCDRGRAPTSLVARPSHSAKRRGRAPLAPPTHPTTIITLPPDPDIAPKTKTKKAASLLDPTLCAGHRLAAPSLHIAA